MQVCYHFAYRMYFLDNASGWPAHDDAPWAMNPLTTPIAYLLVLPFGMCLPSIDPR